MIMSVNELSYVQYLGTNLVPHNGINKNDWKIYYNFFLFSFQRFPKEITDARFGRRFSHLLQF